MGEELNLFESLTRKLSSSTSRNKYSQKSVHLEQNRSLDVWQPVKPDRHNRDH